MLPTFRLQKNHFWKDKCCNKNLILTQIQNFCNRRILNNKQIIQFDLNFLFIRSIESSLYVIYNNIEASITLNFIANILTCYIAQYLEAIFHHRVFLFVLCFHNRLDPKLIAHPTILGLAKHLLSSPGSSHPRNVKYLDS